MIPLTYAPYTYVLPLYGLFFNFGSLCVVLRETISIGLESAGQSSLVLCNISHYDLPTSFSKTSIETAEQVLILNHIAVVRRAHILVVPRVIQELQKYEHGTLYDRN